MKKTLIGICIISLLILSGCANWRSQFINAKPEVYKQEINKFVNMPSSAKESVIKMPPYDVKPYTDFSFMYWWNIGEWYYKVVGTTKPDSNNVKTLDIRVFKLKSNAINIFNQYGVLAFEGDYSTDELRVLRDSRGFIPNIYWVSNYENTFLPILDIDTNSEAINIVKPLFKIQSPQVSKVLTPNDYEINQGIDYTHYMISGTNFNLEAYPNEGYIRKRG